MLQCWLHLPNLEVGSAVTSSLQLDPNDTTLSPMSFGYGVGDFIALGTLAWSVYKSCNGAPKAFENISFEVLSLHAVLKEAEEIVFVQPLSPEKQERLKAVGDGCHNVLTDLDNLYNGYQSLGTQSKRTWDRMRWRSEDIVELRGRLISHTGLLTAWIRYAHAFLQAVDPILIANLLACPKPLSISDSTTSCKSLGKENEKAR
jgi:hypothetical protein